MKTVNYFKTPKYPRWFADKKRVGQVGVLSFLSLATVLTFYLVAQNQDNRQRASSRDISVLISDKKSNFIQGNIWGVNFTGGESYDQFTKKYKTQELSNTGTKIIRFYGGCLSQYYNWRTSEFSLYQRDGAIRQQGNKMSVDGIFQVADAMNARVLYTINISKPTDPADGCGNRPTFDSTIVDARELLRLHKDKFNIVELGNEPWFHWEAQEFKARALEYAKMIKKEFPGKKVIAPGIHSGNVIVNNSRPMEVKEAQEWIAATQQMLDERCESNGEMVPCIDQITVHMYARTGYNPNLNSEDGGAWNFPGVGAYYPTANYAEVFEKLKDYNPRIALTEWNMRCWDGITDDRDGKNPAIGTAEHGLYIADTTLIMGKYNLAMGILHGLTTNNDAHCNLVDPIDRKINIEGKSFSFTSVLAGGRMLMVDAVNIPTQHVEKDTTCQYTIHGCIQEGDYPKVGVYSAYNKEGNKLYIFAINRSNEAFRITPQLSLQRTISSNQATVDYLKAVTFTDTSFKEESITIPFNAQMQVEIPPISVTRITLDVNGDPVPTDTPIPTPTIGTPTNIPTKAPSLTPTKIPTKTPSRTPTPTRKVTATPTRVVNEFGKKYIAGMVYVDMNKNGRYDSGTDRPSSGVRITMTGQNNQNYGTSTNTQGSYIFPITSEGSYTIRAGLATGVVTSPNPVVRTVTNGSSTVTSVNFYILTNSER